MDVKRRMDAGVGKECIASRCLRTQESLGFSDVELAFAVTSPYSAGLDTVSSLASPWVFICSATTYKTAGSIELGLCESSPPHTYLLL